jgi:hypothetical protein
MTQPPGDGPSDPQQPTPPGTPYPQAPGYGPPPGHGTPGYGGPGYPPAYPPTGYYPGPSPYRLPDHPEATKALVLGIVSLLGGFTCYLPILVGPWAWVVGRRVVKQIDAQPGRYDGRGQALAGYVMGVVATVLLILGIVALVGLLVIFVGAAVVDAPAPTQGQAL